MIMIGVISYMPDDESAIKRREAHNMQLAWLAKLFPTHAVNIVAQNYSDTDYADSLAVNSNIVFQKYAKGIGPSKARNVLLKMFVESTCSHLLLMDDDVLVYPYYNCEDILLDIDANPDKYAEINAFRASNPHYVPFKEKIYTDSKNLGFWKFVKRPANTGAQLCVLSKVANMVYFNATNRSEDVGFGTNQIDFSKFCSEDVDYHLRWLQAGYNFYDLETMQLKEPNSKYSTIFSSDNSQRIEQEKQAIDGMLRDYPELKRDAFGKINWSSIFDKYSVTMPIVYIKREKALKCIPDNLKPNKYKSSPLLIRNSLI